MRSTAERIVKSCVCQQENYLKLLQFVASCVGPVGRRIERLADYAEGPTTWGLCCGWKLVAESTVYISPDGGTRHEAVLSVGNGGLVELVATHFVPSQAVPLVCPRASSTMSQTLSGS